MSILAFIFPLIAAVQNPQIIEEAYDLEDQVVIYDDPSEIYEIEFNDEEEEGFLEVE